MKRTLLILASLLLSVTAAAQNNPPAVPPPTYYTVNFIAHQGEVYTVYLDGEMQNRMPQGRVLVNNVSDQTHEVIVVMKRPVEKAAVMALRPGEPNVTVAVNYDPRIGRLYLYTAACNLPQPDDDIVPKPRTTQTVAVATQPTTGGYRQPATVRHYADTVGAGELDSMARRMRALPFDADRLALGKVLVAASSLTSVQIAYLCRTIDYSQSQVEFLKYAYTYCIDKTNYAYAIDVLTYRADKKRVSDYVATQH